MKKLFSAALALVLLSVLPVCFAEESAAQVFSDTETAIIESIVVGDIPCAVVYQQDEASNYLVTYILDGRSREIFDEYNNVGSAGVLIDPGTYTFIIETDQPWTMAVAPLESGDFVEMESIIDRVSNIFTVSAPTIFQITADVVDGNFKVYLYSKSSYGWKREQIVNEVSFSENSPKPYNKKHVIKATEETEYFIYVENNAGHWKIAPIQ